MKGKKKTAKAELEKVWERRSGGQMKKKIFTTYQNYRQEEDS